MVQPLPEPTIVGTRSLLHAKPFEVVEYKVLRPDQVEVKRSVVKHPGAVIILPVTDHGSVWTAYQYRVAIERWLLEFPAGTLEPEEDPLDCAKRELQEEVGFVAEEWISLGVVYPAPGFCSEKQYAFLARTLSPAPQKFDDDEFIDAREIYIPQIDTLIARGDLVDGKSLALMALARSRGLL